MLPLGTTNTVYIGLYVAPGCTLEASESNPVTAHDRVSKERTTMHDQGTES